MDGKGGPSIWSTFITAFLDDAVLIKELITYAARQRNIPRRAIDHLYQEIMAHHMVKDPANARALFDCMNSHRMLPNHAVALLVPHMLASDHYQEAQLIFKDVYLMGTERDLYDTFIREMQLAGVSKGIMQRWHRFLVSQGDLPSARTRALPIVKQLFNAPDVTRKRDPERTDLRNERWIAVKEHVADPFDLSTPFTRERLSTVIGEIHGVKQKSVTDSFCARVFATGGISTGFMIGALSMFGLDTVGPLALRELAARGETIENFRTAQRDLRDRKIDITDCAFSRALRKFASDGRQDLFDSIVHSDRHPDTYEQTDVLERLVETDLLQNRTTDAHALLAILVMSDRNSHNAEWNSLLKAEIRNKRTTRVKSIVEEMLLQRQVIRHASIRSMIDHMLPPRSPGSHPASIALNAADNTDALPLVTQLCLTIMRGNGEVPVTTWRELLKRYGMSGRMRGLSQISTKIAEFHKRTASKDRLAVGLSEAGPKLRHVQYIFKDEMQRAIVVWGFQAACSETADLNSDDDLSSPTNGVEDRSLDGLRLLAQLRDLGVPLSEQVIRREMISRLGIIYTPGVSSANSNRALKTLNNQSLDARVRQIQQIWGGNGLFNLPSSIEKLPADERHRILYKILFKDSGWLRKSQLAMARKWSKPNIHLPKRGVRRVDKNAVRFLQHAWQQRQQDSGIDPRSS
ncbi:Hypothetical protein D9617_29g006610 [Elsinoe fawcettii]|nr:Hypothetical protein D9617_29g006610 [Elsinoe fawcettii]